MERTLTFADQLAFARQMETEELRRHAAISRDNRCGCNDCFCCAALAVIRERQQRKE